MAACSSPTAYEAYAAYERAHPEVAWVGCWARARRKFIEAQGENPKASRVALKLIGRLYRLECEWDDADTLAKRERDVAELALAARAGVEFARSLAAEVGPGCRRRLSARAVGAAVASRRTRADHARQQPGRELHLVENSIRPNAVGKKNWLFIGHPDAGRRAAILYSLIVSCLRDVLTRLPAMTNQDDLDALTPGLWQPAESSAS